MLALLSTDEFAAWFEHLGDADAEEVATALELVEQLGPSRVAPGSRESLLWYQCDPGPCSDWADALLDFTLPARAQLEHLDSQTVRSAMGRLGAEAAAQVSAQLSSMQLRIKVLRYAALVSARSQAERARSAVEQHYGAVLETLGLSAPARASAHGPALRELNLHGRKPGMRILYGVDPERERGLVVLGEYLDRNAYGPSVRRALAAWQRYLDDPSAAARGTRHMRHI